MIEAVNISIAGLLIEAVDFFEMLKTAIWVVLVSGLTYKFANQENLLHHAQRYLVRLRL